MLPNILICFGGLEYDEIQVQIVEKRSKTFNKNVQTKTIKKISFDELYRAIEVIKELNYLMVQKDAFLNLVETKYEERFQEARRKLLEEVDKKSEGTFKIDMESVDDFFKTVPENFQDAICLNLFFIDEKYKNCSKMFIAHVFNYFK